jgi:membrane protein
LSSAQLIERLDAWQQCHRSPSFAVAVLLRFREDRGRDYGALLSYYGFISFFPLLLVLVTVLGIVLRDNADLRNRILDTVYSKIPVVGAQLRQDTSGLSASGWLLAIGLVVAIWSGLAVMRQAEAAFDLQWGAPVFRPPGFVRAQLRGLATLGVVGLGLLASVAVTGVTASAPGLPWEGRVVGGLVAIALNMAVLTMAFRLLLRSAGPWRDLAVGGVLGGFALWVLQLFGTAYIESVVVGASDVYGTFAVVFGLLVWIALLAKVALLASEVNVVRAGGFWPRSLTGNGLTDGDRRAMAQSAAKAALRADPDSS